MFKKLFGKNEDVHNYSEKNRLNEQSRVDFEQSEIALTETLRLIEMYGYTSQQVRDAMWKNPLNYEKELKWRNMRRRG